MKFSSRARYALRMLIDLAHQDGAGRAISLRDIAQRTRLSRRYLEQLAIGLRNAGLIRGVSGRGGGYRLARPAERISIGQVFEAAIGPINVVDCVEHPEACLAAEVCGCRPIYRLLNERITAVLDGFSLADLVQRDRIGRIAEELSHAGQGCPAH